MKPLYQDLPFPIDSHIHYYIEDLPHFIVPWHYHPAIEIMYITRGIGTRFVGDCIEQYEEGDVCMIGPNLPHEWRNDDAYFDKESGLRATCICLFFKREIFDPNFIRLPEMNNIRDLIERSRRGLKFTGNSKLEITRFIRSSVNDVGVRKVTNLLTLLELMATSTEYELLASVGFTNSVNSEDFERFNKVYKFLVKDFGWIDPDSFLPLFQGEDQENLCRISERNAYRLFEKTITGKQNEDFYYQWGSRIP